jgi:hypothetical protein
MHLPRILFNEDAIVFADEFKPIEMSNTCGATPAIGDAFEIETTSDG